MLIPSANKVSAQRDELISHPEVILLQVGMLIRVSGTFICQAVLCAMLDAGCPLPFQAAQEMVHSLFSVREREEQDASCTLTR